MKEHAHTEGGGLQGFIGIILIFIGFVLGAIAFYTWYNNDSKEYRISEILPQENLEFIVLSKEGSIKPPEIEYIQSVFNIILPDGGGIVGYTYEEELSVLSFEAGARGEKTQHIEIKDGKYCEVSQGFLWCSENKALVLSIIEGVMNGKKPLSLALEYTQGMEVLNDEASFWIFGKTSLLKQTLWDDFYDLFPSEEREQFSTILEGIDNSIPFFSGSIHTSQRELFFVKSEEDNFFPPSLSEYNLTADFFPQQTLKYLYITRADFAWSTILEVLRKENLADSFVVKGWAEKMMESVFGDTLSFSEKIFPLLAGNILFMETNQGGGVFFSLPSESIAKRSFEVLQEGLKAKAANASPRIVEYTLSSGEKMKEVFPSDKNMTVQKEQDTNGNLVLYENAIPETGETFTIGMVQKGTYLLVATDSSVVNRFWASQGAPTDFVLPNATGVFTSFGMKFPQEDSSSVMIELEGKGVEQKKGLYFFLEVFWRDGYSYVASEKAEKIENMLDESTEEVKDVMTEE